MNLARRQGSDGDDLVGMAWDEMALPSVVTSNVIVTALEVYNNLRGGALEIELYSGRSKHMISCSSPPIP